ncbi:MAG: chloride channel protein [Salinivirgaceae bacterium]|nr:chloride channel protein [Salinivirgaceae bacterium]MBR5167351.1 chloride channel protein [Salinivirgaceae bacterium]
MKLKFTPIEHIQLWRGKHLTENQFLLILSFVVGLLSGLSAVVLKNTIHYTYLLVMKAINSGFGIYIYLALPAVGILLTTLWLKYFVKDNISHGITRVLFCISRKNGIIKPHNTYTGIVGSSLTIGFGGSVGAEAPIVLTGAAIGSNLGRLFKLNYKQIILMIGCGAAGAVAGIFKAPIAGLVFTLEVLMLDMTMASLSPLLISAVTATLISYLFLGSEATLCTLPQPPTFELHNIPLYLVLGIFAGLLGWYFTATSMSLEKWFSKMLKPGKKIIIGGLILGVLIWLFPPLFGEGYDALREILTGNGQHILDHSVFSQFGGGVWVIVGYCALMLVFKVIATSATTGAGGIGGVFAPSLFMGGILGYMMARLLNCLGFISVSEVNFALVGMAAFMSALMHAPLTGIFLIAEITGGYNLFVPLMVASVSAYVTIYYFEPHSIYTKRLAQSGDLITHNKDRAALTLMRLEKEVEHDLTEVGPDQKLRDLVNAISHSRRNIFPVVDEEGKLMGIVMLDDIRKIMFNTEMYDTTYVYELMTMPPDIIKITDTMDIVMDKFEKSGAWNLPVVRNGLYVGYLSKSKIYTAYRKVLLNFAEE